MRVPGDSMPSNIVENFGNASGTAIPTNIMFILAQPLLNGTLKLCMVGLGVGLTWASMAMAVGQLAFCEIIDY
jgi:3-oxoacyl-[acyl-carrier-protein] synthase-3